MHQLTLFDLDGYVVEALDAPNTTDERLSEQSLESSPWVRRRIEQLGYTGRLVKGWTPPVVEMAVE
jgi:hypothetical protein